MSSSKDIDRFKNFKENKEFMKNLENQDLKGFSEELDKWTTEITLGKASPDDTERLKKLKSHINFKEEKESKPEETKDSYKKINKAIKKYESSEKELKLKLTKEKGIETVYKALENFPEEEREKTLTAASAYALLKIGEEKLLLKRLRKFIPQEKPNQLEQKDSEINIKDQLKQYQEKNNLDYDPYEDLLEVVKEQRNKQIEQKKDFNSN